MGLLTDVIARVQAARETPEVETVTTPITPAVVADPKAAVNGGGGGGITVRPWWDIFPKTPTEVVERTLAEPAVVAPAAVVSKTILKLGGAGLLAGGVGGFLFGRFFGGGGTQELQQEQEADLTQEPDVTVTPDLPVDVGVDPTVQQLLDYITKQQLAIKAGEYDISGTVTGDVGTSEITNITNTYPTHINIQRTITETYPTQITVTKTITEAAIAQAQEATQEQGTDWITVVLIAVAGLIGYSFLKKKA